MTSSPRERSSEAPPARLSEYFRQNVREYQFSRWKLALLAVAAFSVLVGGVLRLSSSTPESDRIADQGNRGESPSISAARESGGDVSATDGAKSDRTGVSSLKPGEPSTILPGIDIRIDPPTGPLPPADPPTGELPPELPEPTGDGPPEPPSPDSESVNDPVSWALLRGGFGFFVGFCVGFAARTLLRFSALVIGGYFLTLIGLSGLGWVEIRWDTMGQQFDQFVTVWGPELQSFETFLAGKIPVAGATLAGLYAGLRRR